MGALIQSTPQLILFDYDGVIADSFKFFAKCYITACQESGLADIVTEADVLALFEDNVYQMLLQHGANEEMIQHIVQVYEREEKIYWNEMHLFDDMAEVLQSLAAQHDVFVITSNVSISVENVLDRYGIAHCVKEVIGAEKEKSKIVKIKKLTAKFAGQDAFYIGDTKGDMLEGKAAGVTTIGVTWGWHTREQLREGGADFIVQSPQELKKTLAGLHA